MLLPQKSGRTTVKIAIIPLVFIKPVASTQRGRSRLIAERF